MQEFQNFVEAFQRKTVIGPQRGQGPKHQAKFDPSDGQVTYKDP